MKNTEVHFKTKSTSFGWPVFLASLTLSFVLSCSPLDISEQGQNAAKTITSPEDRPEPGTVSLRGNPNFREAQLSSDMRLWYKRFWAGIHSSNPNPDLTEKAESGNLYNYGRDLNNHITSLLVALRLTGDLKILDEVDRLAQIMRSKLADEWLDGTKDGYLNWLYLRDKERYYGNDTHEMEDILAHSLVSAFTYAFKVNQEFNSKYAERVQFWTNYLTGHFEAKWRKREKKPSGLPFLDKYLTHAYTQWTRYHYYMYFLTGDSGYHNEALRRANILDRQILITNVNGKKAYVWNHATTEDGGDDWGCQPFTYIRYTYSALIDLHLEKFSIFAGEDFMKPLAVSMLDLMMKNAPNSFGPDICGGESREGLAPSGYDRDDASRFAYSPYAHIALWDETGKIADMAERIHYDIESNIEQPRRIQIPVSMMIYYSDK